MYGGKSSRPWGIVETLSALGPHVAVAMPTAMAAALLLLLAASAPQPLVLPVLSLACLALAALAAAFAWWRKSERRAPYITSWDVSGALALIGCAAAMLSDPENVLQLIGPAMGRD